MHTIKLIRIGYLLEYIRIFIRIYENEYSEPQYCPQSQAWRNVDVVVITI